MQRGDPLEPRHGGLITPGWDTNTSGSMNGTPSFLKAFCRASRPLRRLHFRLVSRTGFSSVVRRPSWSHVQSHVT